jgi:hypothetical protein
MLLIKWGGDYTQAVSVVRASTYRTDKGLTKILADGKNWRPLAATRTSLWLWYSSTKTENTARPPSPQSHHFFALAHRLCATS